MKRIFLSLLAASVVVSTMTTSVLAKNEPEVDCALLLKQSQASLNEDYLAFDQNLDKVKGWRLLADKQCYKEAASLIQTYLNKKKSFSEWQKANLSFHAGQMYAFANDYQKAIVNFKRAIWAVPTGSPVRWNEYVKATIAFLEKDKLQLTKYRDIVAQENNPANIRNLEVLDDMLTFFDSTYSKVYLASQDEHKE
jgi:hypothetical protein